MILIVHNLCVCMCDLFNRTSLLLNTTYKKSEAKNLTLLNGPSRYLFDFDFSKGFLNISRVRGDRIQFYLAQWFLSMHNLIMD